MIGRDAHSPQMLLDRKAYDVGVARLAARGITPAAFSEITLRRIAPITQKRCGRMTG